MKLSERSRAATAQANDLIHIVRDPDTVPVSFAASLKAVLDLVCPLGTILPTARSTAPSGFLLCDGSAVSRTTYADLFSAIGTSYGAGDGSTTFNLPDARGRTLIGAGQGLLPTLTNRVLGQKLGAETHTLSIAEMPQHNHSYTSVTASGSYGAGGSSAGPSYSPQTTGNAGSNNAHNNMQPSLVVNYIIRY